VTANIARPLGATTTEHRVYIEGRTPQPAVASPRLAPTPTHTRTRFRAFGAGHSSCFVAPAMDERASTQRNSFIRLQPAVVMLVRVASWEESPLCLHDLPARVVRVRHPLPARERIRITKPAVIIVGAGVRPKDFELLVDEAYFLGAAVMQLGQVPPSRLRLWIGLMLDKVGQRRTAQTQPMRAAK